jgi:hypothetical protein
VCIPTKYSVRLSISVSSKDTHDEKHYQGNKVTEFSEMALEGGNSKATFFLLATRTFTSRNYFILTQTVDYLN